MDGTRFGVGSLFTKKLRLAQYADGSIYNYRLKIAQAVLYLKKLPDDFTQADVDDYLSMLLDRNRYTISHFKHTVFGLKKIITSIWVSRNLEASSCQKYASQRDSARSCAASNNN